MTEMTAQHRTLIETYLKGQAGPEQVAEFDQLFAEHAGFRELFEQIEHELAPDFDSVTPIAPPDGLLDEILAEIDETEIDGTQTTNVTPIAPVAPASGAVKRAGPEPWRTLSVLTSLAAAVAIGFHLVPSTPGSPPTPEASPLLALMTGQDAPSLMVIVYDIDQRRVLAKLSNTTPPEDAVWQLWLVREGNDVPISLGLMEERSETGAISVAIERELQIGTDVLAISLEPLGGSPQPGPSGPVLFTGKVEPL
jgi:anti-sigma-K factor RskA